MENQPIPQGETEGLNPKSKERIHKGFWELISGLGDFFKHMFDLQSGMDREGTILNIKNNKRMQGANVWLLICSIMVASIGLDLNSQAVIIGAMLISPLMSPILGVGLGVGINDRETLMISLQHFGIAVIIALITSIIYFLLTPYGKMTEQIDVRTVPTFLDAMVAVFGGLAGIVSSSRKDKSNAIPGVAIATALMPPLCVSGFGIAMMMKGQDGGFGIFLNSFYLFFLNSVFIAITTFAIVRFLRFPYKSYLNKKDKAKTTMMISALSIIVLIPSAWILYNIRVEQKQTDAIEHFMTDDFNTDTRDYLSHKVVSRDSTNYVFIDFYSKSDQAVSNAEISKYEQQLKECGIINPKIIARGTSNAEALLDKELGVMEEKNNQKLSEFSKSVAEKDRLIEILKYQKDSVENAVTIKSVVKAAKVFMPHLEDLDLVDSRFDDVPILLVKWDDDLFNYANDLEILKEFVKLETQIDTLVVKGM
ncbi:MAG: putative hydrophobic protein (TIGR00271 family) [Maribacter sp.]|jgi:uncharacterized hydrophobic protein (TIGR00271 family)